MQSGRLSSPLPTSESRWNRELSRYVVEKGSITVDGISLTVVDVFDDGFTVAIIPHTEAATTLSSKGPGGLVNLEVDVTAKHIEKLIAWHAGPEPTTEATP